MSLWSVANGFQGYGPVCALVDADTEAEAIATASEAFRAADPTRPDYWDPTRLQARRVELPQTIGWRAGVIKRLNTIKAECKRSLSMEDAQ